VVAVSTGPCHAEGARQQGTRVGGSVISSGGRLEGLVDILSSGRRSVAFGVSLLVGIAWLGTAGSAAPASAAPRAVPDPAVHGCDVLLAAPARHHCLLPWPNDAFTVAATTPTGRRLHISSKVDPANVDGVHVDTTAENRADGFSPGSVIMTYVSELSIAKSKIATSTDIGSSLAPDAPIVILDTATDVRVPYFAELDAQTTNKSKQLLLIHPAVALTEGHRYAVALRKLVDVKGVRIAPLATTKAALAGTLQPASRGAHIKYVIRTDLASVLGSTVPFQAWDFTVASAASLAGPGLTMHALAYQWLGRHHRATSAQASAANDFAPAFTVTSVTDTNGTRDVHGTFEVPLFLGDTTPYSSLVTDHGGNPKINGSLTWTANFICVLPATVQSGGPATPTVYGHGLLGDAGEVEGGSFSAGVAHDLMGCATDWVGMSGSDVGNVARNLTDMSTFETQVDHMLQGFVNFQFLGRLINSASGFVTDPAFQSGGQPLFKIHDCHFMGYSQGGIMGGAASALSTEWSRAILGVPGMDYGGVLLNRSVDWNEFAAIYTVSYTDPVDQQVVLQFAQLLWDRGENEGYAEHLTAHPYPGIAAKQIFIIENYGDHQVSNVAAEMLARTIGARNHQPAFDPSFFGAAPRLDVPVTPQWGLAPLDQTKPAKAGLVLWDYGTPTPPTTNLAPNGVAYGQDPHGFGRGNALLLDEITTFLATGVIPNECGSVACQSNTP